MPLPGRVIAARRGLYDVLVDDTLICCTARREVKEAAGRVSSPVVVGDWVEVSALGPHQGVIERVHPRRTELARAHEGKPDQVLVANVDQVLVVFAADQPKPNFDKVDHALVAALSQSLPPVLCFNKIDLADAAFWRELEFYRSLPIDLITCSARQGEGIEAVRARIAQQTTVLWGPSGVGKSTLTNALQPAAQQRVHRVAKGTGKGTHTTTAVTLVRIDAQTWIVDTPGWRHLIPRRVCAEALQTVFVDVAPFALRCRFPDCRHAQEPGCAVQEALAAGRLLPRRVAAYRAMAERLADQR